MRRGKRWPNFPLPTPTLTPPKQISRHIFAVLAVLALGAAVGLWYFFNQTTVETLKLGAGMELKYRAGPDRHPLRRGPSTKT